LKRILFSDEARAGVRAIPRHIAMNILAAVHRFAEHGSGDVRELKGKDGEKRLRAGDYRVRFSEEPAGTLLIHSVSHRKDSYR
jgi:mRNA-degrading endonuclease RelE of RelBE toxin-antitoxin system